MSGSTSRSKELTRGYALAVTSALILSTTAIFIRYLTENYHVPSLVLALWRDVFVVLTAAPVLALRRPLTLRVGREQLPFLATYGLILAGFNAMWTISVAENGAAVATVLVYSSAAFTVLLGWWLLGERLSWAKVAATVLALTGCALVSGALAPAAWRANVLGIVTGVLSGLAYASYSLMGRSAFRRGLDPWTTLVYTFGFASAYLLAANLLPGGLLPGAAARPAELLWLGRSATGWGVLFLLAAGPTVVGYGLYNVSLSHLPSSVVNLVGTMEPVFTAATAYALLGERLSVVQAAGSLVILTGVVVLRVCDRPAGAVEPVAADALRAA